MIPDAHVGDHKPSTEEQVMRTSQLIVIVAAIFAVGGTMAGVTLYQWEIRAALRGEQYIGAVGLCGGDNARVCERLF